MLSEKQIEEFRQIFIEDYGIEISYEEAKQEAENLFQLLDKLLDHKARSYDK